MRAGRYELRRPLGHGAMAVVDLVEDVELGRPVALKRLAENLARDEERRSRFLREAKLAARLSHPNVVRVYDVGEEDGRPFIAMEYVEGETLADLVQRCGPLPPEQVVSLGIQACRALAAAHAAGLVHRDVKPHNLLLASDGTLKLGDFGIAVGLEGTRLTEAGTVLGTAAYLAPEQARGGTVSAAADVYGLGAVLYELLAGRPPRTVASLGELGRRDAYRIRDLRETAPSVPGPLAAAVARCLAFDPAERPASAAELARELAAAVPAAETLPLPEPPAQPATQILARPSPRRERRPILLAAVALACAAGGAGAAVALSGGGGPSAPARTVQPRVEPAPTEGQPARQARDLAAWFRRNSR
ncbi:MAG TPA: serine/threonine-protein kinase [Gaiellaceae bacterium]|nr:serine/threonine-protein kinase [Gaiellaceae bacterium]